MEDKNALDFSIPEQGALDFTVNNTAKPVKHVASRATIVSAATGRGVEEVEVGISNGDDFGLDTRAALGKQVEVARGKLSKMVFDGQPLNEDQQRELVQPDNLGPAPEIETIGRGGGFEGQDARVLARTERLNQLAQNYLPKDGEYGFWDAAADVADFVVLGGVSDTASYILGDDNETFTSGNVMRNLAEEAYSLIHSGSITEADFDSRMNDILTRVADAGFLTDSNELRVQTFVGMIAEAGAGAASRTETQAQNFGVVGLLTEAGAVAKGAKAMTAMTKVVRGSADLNPSGIISAARSGEEAIEAGVDLAIRAPESDAAVVSTRPSAQLPSVPNNSGGPTARVANQVEANNRAIEIIAKQNRGDAFDPKLLNERVNEAAADFMVRAGNTRNRVIDIAHEQTGPFGDTINLKAQLGTSKGVPFLKKSTAQKLADDIGGELEETVFEGRDAWVVVRRENISTAGLNNATDMAEITRNTTMNIPFSQGHLKVKLTQFANAFSLPSRMTKEASAQMVTAEASTLRVQKEVEGIFQEALKASSKKEQANVDGFINAYSNDPAYSSWTKPMSAAEFRENFAQMYGRMPTEGEEVYHSAYMEINDALYAVRADQELSRAVNSGQVKLELGDGTGDVIRARKVDNWGNKRVYDSKEEKYLTGDELTARMDDKTARVFEVHPDTPIRDPDGTEIRYVVESEPKLQALLGSDVLPYNYGIRVGQDNGGFFLRQKFANKLDDAAEENYGKANTFMRTDTASQARRAVLQINKLLDNIDAEDFDELVLKNNDWDPSIQTRADFRKFMEDYGLVNGRRITFDPDGEVVDGFGGVTQASAQFIKVAAQNSRRGVRPLSKFGGGDVDLYQPQQALMQSASATTMRHGNARFVNRSMDGLYRAATEAKDETGRAYISDASRAEAERLWKRGRKSEALDALDFSDVPERHAFELERTNIKTSLGHKTALDNWFMAVQRSLGDFVIDKAYSLNKTAIGTTLNKVSPDFLRRAGIWTKEGLTNMANAMRSLAFDLKIGLLAFDQLFVQAGTLVSTAGLSASKAGVTGVAQSFASIIPLRLARALPADSPARGWLAIAGSKAFGTTPDEFLDLIEGFERSGRGFITGSAMEENVGYTMGTRMLSKVREGARVAFNEGEGINRMNAYLVAYKEGRRSGMSHKALMTDKGQEFIVGRSDQLTHHMTNASSAAFQKGLGGIPFQFLTYQRNILEDLFLGVTTKDEKIGLVIAQTLMYGAAGVPLAGAFMDRVRYKYNVNVDDESLAGKTFDVIRWGLLDAMLSGVSDTETAIASRMGAGEGLYTLLRDMGESSFVEIIGGPSVAVTADVGSSLVTAAQVLATGSGEELLKVELNDLANNLTFLSRMDKAKMAALYGTYFSSRTGKPIVQGLTNADAVAILSGMPLRKVQEAYTLQRQVRLSQEDIRNLSGDLRNIVIKYRAAEDPASRQQFLDAIGQFTELVPDSQKRAVFRQVLSPSTSLWDQLQRDLVALGKTELVKGM